MRTLAFGATESSKELYEPKRQMRSQESLSVSCAEEVKDESGRTTHIGTRRDTFE